MKINLSQLIVRCCFSAVMLISLSTIILSSLIHHVDHTIDLSLVEIENPEEKFHELEDLQEEENEFIIEPQRQIQNNILAAKFIPFHHIVPLGYRSNLAPPPWQNC